MSIRIVAEYRRNAEIRREECLWERDRLVAADIELPCSVNGEEVCIDLDELREGASRLMTLELWNPECAGAEGDGGATFVPYGCGALIRHAGHPAGEETMEVFYPCGSTADISLFGTQDKNENGVGAVVTDGRYDLTLKIRRNFGEQKEYAVGAVFAIRDKIGDAPLSGRIRMEYFRFSGSWVAAARHYRERMTQYLKVPTLHEKCKTNPVLSHSAHSLSLRFRMGVRPVPETDADPDQPNNASIRVYMTFADVRLVADECFRQGVRDVEFTLVGWNKGGHDGAYPQLFPVEEAFGGETELLRTVEYCKSKGYPVSLHDNYFDCYAAAENYTHDAVHLLADESDLLGGVWGAGRARQLCARAAYRLHAQKNMEEVRRRLNPEGVYYIDVLSLAQLTKCYAPAHPMSRADNAFWWKKILKTARDLFGAVSSEGGRDWALPELDRAYSLAGTEQLPAGYDEEIPLVPVAWHGFLLYNTYRSAINRGPESSIFWRNLAYGGIPLAYFHQIFLPRLTAADGWSEDLLFSREHPAESVRRIGAMAEVFASLAHLTLETIEDFRRDGEVSLTRFSDGTTLLVDIANRKMELKR